MKVIYLCLVLLFISCKKSNDAPTGPSPAIDFLSNSTFESNGNPSLAGWIVPDTSAVRFSSDIPSGGTGYSIVLQTQTGGVWPGKSVYTNIIPSAGKHRYRLSCFTKKTGTGGYCAVYLKRGSMMAICAQFNLSVIDTIWTNSTCEDTLTTVPQDTLIVNVNGGMMTFTAGTTYFNSCQFTKIY
jgi:hypothetical protein